MATNKRKNQNRIQGTSGGGGQQSGGSRRRGESGKASGGNQKSGQAGKSVAKGVPAKEVICGACQLPPL